MITNTSVKQSVVVSVRIRYVDLANIHRELIRQNVYCGKASKIVKTAAVGVGCMNADIQSLDDAINYLLEQGVISPEETHRKSGFRGNFTAAEASINQQQSRKGSYDTPIRGISDNLPQPLPSGVNQKEVDEALKLFNEQNKPKVVEVAPELSDLGNMPNVEQIASDD